MKCKIPEISWHNRDPVLSVDIQSKYVENTTADTYRLASGGTDSHVLIWYITLVSDGSDINLELAADLTRHQRAVNVVKWSPNGELLASGDDESVIFIWKQKTETDPPNILENTTEQDKEVWLTMKILRGHMEDVYDLCWSPNSQFLVSGSVDNTAMIWDVYKGKSTAIFRDHKGFVQGVAWDPCNQYVATLSTDRYLRIFDIQSKRVLQRINKSTLNVPDGHVLHGKRMRLFHDDTLQTFFRRLSFTPDGKLLLTPAGVTDFEGCTKPLHTTYGFSRFSFRQPALILPCPDQYTVAVSCCPLIFALRPYNAEVNPPVVPLPYRMIFAVATRSSVYFYDTQQRQPFAIISNIHYTRLTDITWSSDGCLVIVSSTDGFCSLITFEKGELGEKYEKTDEVLMKTFAASDSVNSIGNKKSKKHKENDAQESSKSRKPSVDESSAIKSKSTPTPTSTEPTTPLKQIDELNKDEEKEGLSKDKDISNTMKNKADPIQQKPSSPKAAAIIKPLIASEIILDKEILSSDEKFESPAKKTISATPISVRRHPRSSNSHLTHASNITPSNHPSATTSPKSTKTGDDCKNENVNEKEIVNSDEKMKSSPEKKSPRSATPISIKEHPHTPNSNKKPQSSTQSTPSETITSKLIKIGEDGKISPQSAKSKIITPKSSSKAAKPIAIRRKPRVLVPTTIDPPAVVEEAMDAWPTPIPPSPLKKQETTTVANKSEDTAPQPQPQPPSIEITSDRTEDIRLVYEDTVEDESLNSVSPEKDDDDEKLLKSDDTTTAPPKIDIATTPKQSKDITPLENRTPRRVEFKTISTPKSKKKL